jgi:hypothetical protein
MNFFGMKLRFLSILLLLSALPIHFSGLYAQSDQPEKTKEKTTEEMAAEEAERLERLLKLEDWQVFYVDSTLQHDYAALKKEILALQNSKVENYDIYTLTQDKWMERIDKSYKKFFNEAQWTAYLKNGGAKAIKAREKRRIKAEKAGKK